MSIVEHVADKSQFILQVTHELRGPVAAVLGYHEMILKGVCGEVTPEVRKNLTKANRRTRGLLVIIDEMLDFARMNTTASLAGKEGLIDIHSLIQDTITPFLAEAGAAGVQIEHDIPRPLYIKTNNDLMEIVITNLVSNAVKYSPEGGKVTVTALRHGNYLRIQIADQGMGIEKEEIGRIFGEFYRSRRARMLDDNGTGLGLCLVQKALGYLNGHICVESSLHDGALFTVCIPFDTDTLGCPCKSDAAGCKTPE